MFGLVRGFTMARKVALMDGDIATKLSGSRTDLVKPGLLEYSFWGFLLVDIGRIGELVPGLSSIPLGKITLGLCVVSLIVNWKSLSRTPEKAVALGRTVKALLCIALLLTPFSFWKGGTVEFVTIQLPVLVAVTVVAYKMGRFWPNVRGTMLALVICGVVLALSALAHYHGGRASTGTMYDTNDLAYVLVTVFPLAVGFAITARTRPRRMMYWGMTVIVAVASLLTESRGGLLGLIAELALFLFTRIAPVTFRAGSGPSRGSSAAKIAGVLGAVCVGTIIWFHLPQSARNRFDTILNLGSDYNLNASDVTGRREIWTRGLEATRRRPLGYGLNTFSMVDLKFGGHFMAPHNSFLEIMVELGVPGLALFIGTYLLALRGLQVVRRKLIRQDTPLDQDTERVAFARVLQYSLVGNAVSGFFLTMAYATLLWTLIGTCMALVASVNRTRKPPHGNRRDVTSRHNSLALR